MAELPLVVDQRIYVTTSIITFILTLFLLYRIHVIGSELALIDSVRATRVEILTELVYKTEYDEMTKARFPFKRNRLRCVRCVNENRKKRNFSRNKRKRQQIGMLGRSSGNHDWLLANASACV